MDRLLNKAKEDNLIDIEELGLKEEELYFRDINNTSIGFNTGAEKATEVFLAKRFKLSNHKQFARKFRESISGDGNELAKISALHSSSLCALLCFYNVGENKTIKWGNYEYDKVYFEVRNKVVGNPSNMDVVLTDEKDGAILFIECKFLEYKDKRKEKLAEAYAEGGKYADLFSGIEYNEKRQYQSGHKQIVTHCIGIVNYINGDNNYMNSLRKYYQEEDERKKLYEVGKFTEATFLELIFDNNDKDFEDYKNEAEKTIGALRDIMIPTFDRHNNRIEGNKQINELGITTYKTFFKTNNNLQVLDEMVKKFYKFDEH